IQQRGSPPSNLGNSILVNRPTYSLRTATSTTRASRAFSLKEMEDNCCAKLSGFYEGEDVSLWFGGSLYELTNNYDFKFRDMRVNTFNAEDKFQPLELMDLGIFYVTDMKHDIDIKFYRHAGLKPHQLFEKFNCNDMLLWEYFYSRNVHDEWSWRREGWIFSMSWSYKRGVKDCQSMVSWDRSVAAHANIIGKDCRRAGTLAD
nr:hypothetical protein [Tanacetum cinerariifolium]